MTGPVNSAAPQSVSADHGRIHPRTHLFVIATLYSDSGSAPVHVRNMSPSGALIESAVLPELGTKVRLKRGSLQASGRIVWKAGRKAGVSFAGNVHVADWMLKTPSPQERVDRIISDYKANGQHAQAAPESSCHDEDGSVRSELALLRAELTQLGNLLSNDVILVATHPELQLLDISLQRVERLIGRL